MARRERGGSAPRATKASPSAMERYASLLRARGLRATSQRLEIYSFLAGREDHLDVDTIYTALRARSPTLSRTTVYNTVEQLHLHGLVQAITISGTERRYEVEKGCHHHLLCRECGRIYDIMIECPFLGEMLLGEHRVEEVHGYFLGVCKSCLSKRGQDNH